MRSSRYSRRSNNSSDLSESLHGVERDGAAAKIALDARCRALRDPGNCGETWGHAGGIRANQTYSRARTEFHRVGHFLGHVERALLVQKLAQRAAEIPDDRSEERRVGKEGRSRWSPD